MKILYDKKKNNIIYIIYIYKIKNENDKRIN